MFRVLIGIQARSTSQRFPNKMLASICGRPMIAHVLEKCWAAAEHKPRLFKTTVAVLIPLGDELLEWSERSNKTRVLSRPEVLCIQGDADDLIARYQIAIDQTNPNAIIRVTGDEPLLPTKLITAVMDQLCEFDYVSNTVIRTYYEGYDIQGCSRKSWDEFFSKQPTREHPFKDFDMNEVERDKFEAMGFKWSQLINSNNQNQIHLSVDVPEDIQRVERFLDAEETK